MAKNSSFEIRYRDHGWQRKIERDVPKKHIKYAINNADVPHNRDTYIPCKKYNFVVKVKRWHNTIWVITVITDPGMINIKGYNPCIIAV